MLSIVDQWVWDFWIADDGVRYHCFYLFAPHSLGDPHARHRHARIGHAVSADLRDWTVLGTALEPGPQGSFDETATWTGSVVKGEDGLWRMFYTGSKFLAAEPDPRNIETVGVAVSHDLHQWIKRPGPVVQADPRWYETWGTSSWREEAWRDPWVFRDPDGDGWHMIATARSRYGAEDDRGVLGHAWSADLEHWQVGPPLTRTESGYGHLEVPQLVRVGGQWTLLYSCPTDMLSTRRQETEVDGGVWYLPVDNPTKQIDLSDARLLLRESRYSGRLVQERSGQWVLMAFTNDLGAGFVGAIDDPIPVAYDDAGSLALLGGCRA